MKADGRLVSALIAFTVALRPGVGLPACEAITIELLKWFQRAS